MRWLQVKKVATDGGSFLSSTLGRQGPRDAGRAVAGLGETHAHMATDEEQCFIFAVLRRWCCCPLGNQVHRAVELSKRGQATPFLTETRFK